MFGFFKNFKSDVTKAFDVIHNRLVVLENKVDTLFGDKADASPTAAPAEPVVPTPEGDNNNAA